MTLVLYFFDKILNFLALELTIFAKFVHKNALIDCVRMYMFRTKSFSLPLSLLFSAFDLNFKHEMKVHEGPFHHHYCLCPCYTLFTTFSRYEHLMEVRACGVDRGKLR